MPSDAFAQLSDGETADLIAYLRTFPAEGRPSAAVKQFGPVGRIGVLLGKFRSAPVLKTDGQRRPVDLGPQYAQGRSLARACVECHGLDLKGSEGIKSPDLAIAGAYDPADFERCCAPGSPPVTVSSA